MRYLPTTCFVILLAMVSFATALDDDNGWRPLFNGYKTAELTDNPGRSEGRIALQLYGGQEMQVQYKDIKTCSPPAAELATLPKLDNAFFVFDNGTGGDRVSLEDQAALVEDLGYAGIGYSGADRIPEMLTALDALDVKMFSIYVNADISDEQPLFTPNLQQAIEQLEGRDTVIWITVTGFPDDGEHDDRAVAAIRQVGEWAKEADLRVALYPHAGFYVARFEDAMRVADKVDMPNVGTSFNLCHWIRSEGDRDYAPLLRQAMPRLMLVSINGADHVGGWDKLIQTLDRGEYDVFEFIKTLRAMGYAGPVGLQCYGLQGDRRENLLHSIDAWHEFVERMENEANQ